MANMFKGPALPTPSAPARMPDPFDPAIIETKRRQAAERLSTGGRDSTILSTTPSRGAGFDSYSSTKTGSAA